MKKIWLMYLRKSRADNPDESVEEVLAKHETILQEYAQREFGHTIEEKYIYREVVSGESIADRIEIKKVLREIENPIVEGILVVDPQRLSRGDLEDCGRLINDLKYTNTLVATPMMVYDMNNKMERRFFQDDLLRGRDFYEYVREIMWRGRVASAKRGCYVGAIPPFGYDRVKMGKDWTLVPNDDADTVRLIFDMSVNQSMIPSEIAKELNRRNIPNRHGKPWTNVFLAKLITNRHYEGKIVFGNKKTVTVIEDGERVVKHLNREREEVIVVEGKHPAIIDHDTFEKAQELRKSRWRGTKESLNRQLQNPLATILVCKECGHTLRCDPPSRKGGTYRYMCRYGNHCKSVPKDVLLNAFVTALEQTELPKLQSRASAEQNGPIELQKKIVANIQKQLDELKAQEETQYELLETKKYTQDVFDRRNGILREKMKQCEEQLKNAEESIPRSQNLEQKVITLQEAITSFRNDKISAKEKNRLIKTIVEKVEYSTKAPQKRGETKFTLEITMKI